MKELIYKLKVPAGTTYESILDAKEKDGKFVFYQYVIPRPWFTPGLGSSKIYFKQKGDINNNAWPYNLISLIIGWWGLPFGPMHVYKTIRNNRVGNDITEDVYSNLNKDDFKQGIVKIKEVATVFMPLSKEYYKELRKCFKKYVSQNGEFASFPIAGWYIDTDTPEIYIGLDSNDFHKEESLRKALKKYFYARTRFRFVCLEEQDELTEKLKKQGTPVALP